MEKLAARVSFPREKVFIPRSDSCVAKAGGRGYTVRLRQHSQTTQCPEKEMNKNFENQQRDLCREVQYASEVPKNYLRTLCVIGSPMQIFK